MAGIGPATSPLPRECSTTEPQGQNLITTTKNTMERETGIEPVSLAWKAKVLPLNYSRIEDCGFEAHGRHHSCRSPKHFVVEEAGFEPA